MAEKRYSKVHWVNDETPVNATNLNNMDDGIDEALKGVNRNSEQIEDVDGRVTEAEEKIELAVTVEEEPYVIPEEDR